MTVIINGTTGIDTVQNSIITSAKIASGQTFSLNGIQFPSSQSASSDANCLDDYEEGTWTPTHSDGTATSTSSTCWYRKIGDLVIYAFDITATKASATIGGLPFTSKSSGYGNFPWYNGYETTSQSVLCGHVNSGSTSFNFYNQSTGVAIQNGERVIGAGIYLAAS